METSLHRQLKRLYAGDEAQTEVSVGGYRIDAVVGELLVEIQHGSLAAIRDKTRQLARRRRVLIVKPIVERKTIIRLASAEGPEVGRRMSPKRGRLLDIFDELVYFTRVFPRPKLTLEIVLVEVEELRCPGHGRRRRWRRDDHVVCDQKLLRVGESLRLETAADLAALLPAALPKPFHTGHLAALLSVRRNVAQRIAYCLRHIGTIRETGKQGNARLYQLAKPRASSKKSRARVA